MVITVVHTRSIISGHFLKYLFFVAWESLAFSYASAVLWMVCTCSLCHFTFRSAVIHVIYTNYFLVGIRPYFVLPFLKVLSICSFISSWWKWPYLHLLCISYCCFTDYCWNVVFDIWMLSCEQFKSFLDTLGHLFLVFHMKNCCYCYTW